MNEKDTLNPDNEKEVMLPPEAPVEDFLSDEDDGVLIPPEAPEEDDLDQKESSEAGKPAKIYGTGTAIAAFIFFALTACVFIAYEYFSFTFLYMPFANGINNIGEAIAAIFGYTIGLVITIAFGLAQLPENIISIILFKRVRSCATGGKRILYTVFFALSIVMLIVMILSIAIFFAIIGANS